jgi:glucokinase-like ROK family protein
LKQPPKLLSKQPSKQTGDLNLVKKINKSLVLETIKAHSPISRAAIAERTGLTKATVSTLVGELIGSSMVHEIGAGQSSGGRKPVMLLFNQTAGYAVGVDLGVDYIVAVLTDLNGEIVAEHSLRHVNESVEAVIDAVKAAIKEVVSRAPASAYGIIGIGIGVPGISDENGNVLFAPNLGWHQVPLQAMIEQAFSVPVVIDNEANAGAVGEMKFGVGQDAQHLIYVSISSGIGTGVIIRGELYRGVSGFSGEMGHSSIELNGPACRCGNVGCWELYASEQALLTEAQKLPDPAGGDQPTQDVDIDSLLKLAAEGDSRVIALFERMGTYLGIGLVNIINCFNPELIVIGGRVTAAGSLLEKPLLQMLTERSLPFPRAKLNVRFSTLGAKSAVLGASSFAISAFFASTKVTLE